jgi:hypothetical protein
MMMATTTVLGSVSTSLGTGIESPTAPTITPGTLVVPILEIDALDAYNIFTAQTLLSPEMHITFDAPYPPYCLPCSASGCLTPGP